MIFSSKQRKSILHHYWKGHSAEDMVAWKTYGGTAEEIQAVIDDEYAPEKPQPEFSEAQNLADRMFPHITYDWERLQLLEDLADYIKGVGDE